MISSVPWIGITVKNICPVYLWRQSYSMFLSVMIPFARRVFIEGDLVQRRSLSLKLFTSESNPLAKYLGRQWFRADEFFCLRVESIYWRNALAIPVIHAACNKYIINDSQEWLRLPTDEELFVVDVHRRDPSQIILALILQRHFSLETVPTAANSC